MHPTNASNTVRSLATSQTPTNNATDAASYFDKYFELVRADTPELKRAAYQLRFTVYCQQLKLPGFEPHRFPSGLEIDAYDSHSQQCFLRHRPSGDWAGIVRLVLPHPSDPDRPFPIEAEPASPLTTDWHKDVDRQRVAEISRLIVTEQFRRRRGEATTPYGAPTVSDRSNIDRRRSLPLPLLGLLGAVHTMAAENHIDHLLAAIDPSLNRRLRALGVDLEPIGPEIFMFGRRLPCLRSVSALFANAKRVNPDAWDVMTNRGACWTSPSK